jgi:SAM-dependent methyltransferase
MEKTGYDLLAPEYYDEFHKTCRNFDTATAAAMAKDQIKMPDQGMILEVGCGRGRSNEFLDVSPNRIVQLDASREMLALEDRESSALRVLADATSVPLFDKQFSGVVGFLIDPFIGLAFFSEAHRLLVPAGFLLVTSPAAEWAISLRGHEEPEASSARFVKKDRSSVVVVPSTVMSSTRIAEMLAFSGFEGITITQHCLPEGTEPVSPDIQVVAGRQEVEVHEIPILYVIRANRPH